MESSRLMKEEGQDCDLASRLAADPDFGMTLEQIYDVLDPKLYIGRCPEQVTSFLQSEVWPVVQGAKAVKAEINV